MMFVQENLEKEQFHSRTSSLDDSTKVHTCVSVGSHIFVLTTFPLTFPVFFFSLVANPCYARKFHRGIEMCIFVSASAAQYMWFQTGATAVKICELQFLDCSDRYRVPEFSHSVTTVFILFNYPGLPPKCHHEHGVGWRITFTLLQEPIIHDS